MNSPLAAPPGQLLAGRRAPLSLRTVLLCLVLACLLPGLLGAGFMVLREYRQGRAQLEREALQTARALVQAVDAQIGHAEAVAKALSVSGSAIGRGDLALFHRQAREAVALEGLGGNIVLMDERGRQLVNTRLDFGASLPGSGNPALVQRVFASGRPAVSDLFVGGASRRPIMAVMVPVKQGERIAYVLGFSIQADRFSAFLRRQEMPPGRVATVFDSQGVIAGRTREADKWVGQTVVEPFLGQIRQAREGVLETRSMDGIPVLAAYSISPESNWGVAIGIPRDVLAGELTLTFGALALGLGGLLFLGLGLAWFMGGRIARSVQALRIPAAALGAGIASPLPPLPIREAEEVARAMEEAARLLARRSADLRQATAQLRAITAHAPVAIAVFDRDMRYVAVSRRWLADHRLPEENLIGRSHYDVVPDLPEAWKDAHRRGLAGDVLEAAEDSFLRADGSVQWLRWELWPWRDESGAVGGIVIAAEDVTAAREARLALHDSKARFEAVFEQAAVGIARVGLDGRWLQVNDGLCAIVGYGREELLDLGFPDITHLDDLGGDLLLAEGLLAGEKASQTMEKRYIRKDGSLVWVKLTVSLVRTAAGEPDYFIAVVEDIQGRKEAEAALEGARQSHLLHLEQQVAERTAALREAHDFLEARVAKRTEEVRRLAAEVTYAEERERQALARDLHDDLGQVLHVLRLKLGLLGREELPVRGRTLVDDALGLVADATRKVRSTTSQLSPPTLAARGLPSALRWLAANMEQTYGLAVACAIEVEHSGLPPAQEAILFRAARELLINVAKHAGTGNATLELVRRDDILVMAVTDRGRGLAAPAEELAGAKGFGLASVRERISFLGGTMAMQVPPGGGLRIALQMPLEGAREDTPS